MFHGFSMVFLRLFSRLEPCFPISKIWTVRNLAFLSLRHRRFWFAFECPLAVASTFLGLNRAPPNNWLGRYWTCFIMCGFLAFFTRRYWYCARSYCNFFHWWWLRYFSLAQSFAFQGRLRRALAGPCRSMLHVKLIWIRNSWLDKNCFLHANMATGVDSWCSRMYPDS